jgi:tRNA pseudouridine55 synthase
MPLAERDVCLLPLDALLQSLPEAHLEAAQQARFLQGQTVPWDGPPQARVRVYGPGGTLLGVGAADAGGTISPKRVVANA